MLPSEPPLVRRSASGTKARKGGGPEVKPRYREKFTSRGLCMEYGRLAWRRYSADETDIATISTHEEQDALTEPASLIVCVAIADVGASKADLSSSPVVPSEEKNWSIEDLVKAGEREQVGVKHRLSDLQDSCRAKRHKVP